VAALGELVRAQLADGPLRSLLVDGIIAGVGGVLVFLPQILILFAFILALEDSGYLPRAAFLLDRVMGGWACRGARSFRCCPALPAPCRASWPRAPSATGATGWPPS
jgi:ferrous iron transport protein B